MMLDSDLLFGLSISFVDIFFREERMPLEEGWIRSDVPITGALLQNIINDIVTASEWPGPNSNCSELVTNPNGNGLNLN